MRLLRFMTSRIDGRWPNRKSISGWWLLMENRQVKRKTYREWQREQGLPRQCVFCGSTENLQTDHLMPHSISGSETGDILPLNYSRKNTIIYSKSTTGCSYENHDEIPDS